MTRKTILNQLKSITLGAFLAYGSIVTAEEAAMKQIVVDDDKVECASAQFSSIQEAVNAAAPGTEIKVCAGSYHEQVSINKTLRIVGDEGAVLAPTEIKTNASNLAMYEDMAAVLSIKGAADVFIQGLTMDGKNSGMTDCSAELAGIVFEDASGEINGVTIRNMSSASSESCQTAYGIFAQSSDSGETDLKVNGSNIDSCKSGAIVGNNLGTIVRASGNKISGSESADTNVNGLQLAFGAIGTAKGNSVAAIQ